MQNSWQNNSSLKSFPAIQAENCSNFLSAWQGCTALTSFPAGAKLGTAASNVNFTSAWQQSGLTSFNTPLPTATNLSGAFYNCASLKSFSSPLPKATNLVQAFIYCTNLNLFDVESLPEAIYLSYAWAECQNLVSFDTSIPKAIAMPVAWSGCVSLTNFSADVFANWNPSSITSGIFNNAWDGCSALSAQSVENILTSISASGQFATVDGNSGSAAIADAAIDIDYNAASGSLSAATNTAVTSLKAKGWSIIVNNVTL
jgi:hypothetical protein